MASGKCKLGGRLRPCKQRAEHTCQYCARDFCHDHSYYVEGYEAVCTRKPCVTKHDDLQRHLGYKEEVLRRNKAGLCAEPDCEATNPAFQCSFCRGHFCPEHIQERNYAMQEGWVKVDKQVSLCAWCWGRRKVWQKR